MSVLTKHGGTGSHVGGVMKLSERCEKNITQLSFYRESISALTSTTILTLWLPFIEH